MSNEELVKQIQNGFNVTASMQTLYENNMPLIRQCVTPYAHYENMEDLMQEAYLGLWQAVQRYDASMDVKFMTYAVYWIKQAVVSYIENNGSCVRIPNHFQALIRRYKKYVEQFSEEHGEKPNMGQIQRDLGCSEKQVKEIRMYMQEIQSIDAPLGANANGETYTLSDTLCDNSNFEADIVEREFKKALCDDIWYAVENYLSDRQKDVIYMTYKENKTLDAIGQSMGITRERVRKLRAAGLRRLSIGEAKRLLIKYAETDKFLYTGCSVKKFENYGSNVENIAVRRVSIEQWVKEELERRMTK